MTLVTIPHIQGLLGKNPAYFQSTSGCWGSLNLTWVSENYLFTLKIKRILITQSGAYIKSLATTAKRFTLVKQGDFLVPERKNIRIKRKDWVQRNPLERMGRIWNTNKPVQIFCCWPCRKGPLVISMKLSPRRVEKYFIFSTFLAGTKIMSK